MKRMTSNIVRLFCLIPLWHTGSVSLAQSDGEATGSIASQVGLGLPPVEVPPRAFETAEAHYRFLLDSADGGTQHTMETIPVWEGLWTSGNNSMPSLFLEGATLMMAIRPGGEVKRGVLTPPYEEHFIARREEMLEYGEQRYDRLTNSFTYGSQSQRGTPGYSQFVSRS